MPGDLAILVFAATVLLLWVITSIQTITNLATVPRLRRRVPSAAFRPFVSVIIPARNEAEHIGATVSAMLAQSWSPFEVIVVDDGSDDGTGDVVRAIAQRDPRVHLVEGLPRPEGWLGKPWALQQGADAATGELILFVDADVRYSPGTIESMVAEAGENPDTAMFFAFPRFEMRGVWENVLMPALPSGLLMGIPVWLSNRTTAPILGIGGGPGNLVRHDVYRKIGGHTRLRNAVVDDVGLARIIRAHGQRTRALRADHLIHIRMYRGARQVIDGFSKNAYMVFGGTLPRAAAFALFVVTLHVTPWLWLAGAIASILSGHAPTTPAILGCVSLLLLLMTRVVIFTSLRYNLAVALFMQPFEVAIWQWILLRSTWRLGVRRTLHWRGRAYPGEVSAFGDFSGISK